MDFKALFGRWWGRGAPTPAPAAPPGPIDPVRLEAIRAQLRRRAIRMEIGGFRPPEGLDGSWFGRVNLALPGEAWPTSEGRPLHALAQVDLATLPFRPPRLGDLEMITVFISDDLPFERPNGDGWCLRAYPDRSRLVPLPQVDTGSEIRPFPMRPEVIDVDYPMWEDVPMELVSELLGGYYDLFPTREYGFKLGGWPSLVQHEIGWTDTEYVFQIDSTEKGYWSWGDSGVGYFGRGTSPGRADRWELSWQCY